jgi:hypothetical protein
MSAIWQRFTATVCSVLLVFLLLFYVDVAYVVSFCASYTTSLHSPAAALCILIQPFAAAVHAARLTYMRALTSATLQCCCSCREQQRLRCTHMHTTQLAVYLINFHTLASASALNWSMLQILPWYSFTVPGMLHLLVLTASTGLALRCYFLCMFTDPGR